VRRPTKRFRGAFCVEDVGSGAVGTVGGGGDGGVSIVDMIVVGCFFAQLKMFVRQ